MTEKLKVVIDTSVFVAAFKSKQQTSNPIKVINKWLENQILLVITPQIQKEIIVTFLKVGISRATTENLITLIEKTALQYPGSYEVYTLDDIDPKDNMFFAASLESEADYLVSLDKQHILPTKHYNRIGKVTQVVDTYTFLSQLERNFPSEKKIKLEIKDLINNEILLKI